MPQIRALCSQWSAASSSAARLGEIAPIHVGLRDAVHCRGADMGPDEGDDQTQVQDPHGKNKSFGRHNAM
eukprot:CAMPEP_0174385908 /NCGR_PEP_ID=MMETSP0811_2-20130205/126921_1 /TAXON_ID=73025 ORGANISM="Eutreptiella gymnastica-like, Strain CCMP1594" /NCGR_SAMPLE_ID=MMETSP0811_2 /ASSEMBLY_ACC=CAM_ASM_000667 /LENGTH=69 /DNA_ID=CAMNT_0015540397 /DNA_START=617 /DNA_END=827 /DNA_ORIENTATION=+